MYSSAPFSDARIEHAAVAILGVVQHLETRDTKSLSALEQGFLKDFAFLSAQSPEVVSLIWNQPLAYLWSRMCYESAAAHFARQDIDHRLIAQFSTQTTTDHSKRFEEALQHFGRFVLGAALLADTDYTLCNPAPVTLPFSIPAVNKVLFTSSLQEIVLLGLEKQSLRISIDGEVQLVSIATQQGTKTTQETVYWDHLPQVDFAGHSIVLDPFAVCFQTEASAAKSSYTLGLEFQCQHQEILQKSLHCIKRAYPSFCTTALPAIRLISFKPLGADNYTNVSDSLLPGALFLSSVENPYELADSIIHEQYHHQLFSLEELTALFISQSAAEDAFLYSPLRNDIRHARGVFHALFVSLPVIRYWLGVCPLGDISKKTRMYAQGKALRTMLQAHMLAEQLSSHASLSKEGAALLAELRQELLELEQTAQSLPEFQTDCPSYYCDAQGNIQPQMHHSGKQVYVREELASHLERYCPLEQKAAMREVLHCAFGKKMAHASPISAEAILS